LFAHCVRTPLLNPAAGRMARVSGLGPDTEPGTGSSLTSADLDHQSTTPRANAGRREQRKALLETGRTPNPWFFRASPAHPAGHAARSNGSAELAIPVASLIEPGPGGPYPTQAAATRPGGARGPDEPDKIGGAHTGPATRHRRRGVESPSRSQSLGPANSRREGLRLARANADDPKGCDA
jgi:hypothetical protein